MDIASLIDEARASGDAGKLAEAARQLQRHGVNHAHRRRLQRLATEVRKNWQGLSDAPEIVVLSTMADPRTPAAARLANERQIAHGAKGQPRGFILDDRIYIVASALDTKKEALCTIAHESIGHWGLRHFYGHRLNDLLDLVARRNWEDILRKAAAYGLDVNNEAQRREAAEELLAEIAAEDRDPSLNEQLEAVQRATLRDLVPSMRNEPFTRAELLANFIAPVRERMRRGTPAPTGAPVTDPRASDPERLEAELRAATLGADPEQVQRMSDEELRQALRRLARAAQPRPPIPAQRLSTLAALMANLGEPMPPGFDATLGVDAQQRELIEEAFDGLAERLQIRVADDGLVEVERITPAAAAAIGRLPVAMYHHTSSALADKIASGGLIVGKQTNFFNSQAGVYLSTMSGGMPVDIYSRRAALVHGGEPMVLRVRRTLDELTPDPDDADLAWAQGRQYVTDHVPAHDLRPSQGQGLPMAADLTEPALPVEPASSVFSPDGQDASEGVEQAGTGEDGSEPAQRPSQQPVFVSALRRAIEQLPSRINTMPASQWRQWILANAARLGVRRDELAWTGLADYLSLRGQDRLPKAEIVQYLDAQAITLGETVLRQPGDFAGADEALNYLSGRYGLPPAEVREYLGVNTDDEILAFAKKVADDQPDETKYSQYKLPGGNCYREVLITLPPSPRKGRFDVLSGTDGSILFKGDSRDQALTWIEAHQGMPAARGAQVIERSQGQAAEPEFKSEHWDRPNVIVHLRVDDRIDADGKRVLCIHEIQSDWGQAGRKKGFHTGKLPEGLEVRKLSMPNPMHGLGGNSTRTLDRFAVFSANGNQLTQGFFTAKAAIDAALADRVVSGPFVTSTAAWVRLALKRAMMMAVEGDYDRIALVGGDQVGEVFKLMKTVKSIGYTPLGDDHFKIYANDEDHITLIDEPRMSLERVRQMLGDEAAEAMRQGLGRPAQGGGQYAPDNTGFRSLSGLNVKVGAEGLRHFYDEIVPQVAGDLLRQLGGEGLKPVVIGGEALKGRFIVHDLDSGEIVFRSENPQEALAYSRVYAGDARVRDLGDGVMQPDFAGELTGFDITDAMRDTLRSGVPMFQRVWHGSPVAGIEQFDTAKVGTGEGAQTYGWGLYFASVREVAQWYRDKLSAEESYVDGEILDASRPRHFLAMALADNGGPEGAKEFLQAMALPGGSKSVRQSAEEALRLLDAGEAPAVELRHAEGQLYEVEIPDDGTYLLWDKPLSDQPAQVLEALAPFLGPAAPLKWTVNRRGDYPMHSAANGRYGVAQRGTGSSLYHLSESGLIVTIGEFPNANAARKAAQAHADTLVARMDGATFYRKLCRDKGSARAASESLAALGITGIKYLDGDSRRRAEGSHNYVVFDAANTAVLALDIATGTRRFPPAEMALRQALADQDAYNNDPAGWFKARLDAAAQDLEALSIDVLASGGGRAARFFMPDGSEVTIEALDGAAQAIARRFLDIDDEWAAAESGHAPTFFPREIQQALDAEDEDTAFDPRFDRAPKPAASDRPADDARRGRATEAPDTPGFKTWFAQSRAVDAQGRPLVLYHGTNQDITRFAAERLGANTGAVSARAFFFTDDPQEANEYAQMSARKQVSNAVEREANAERLLKAIARAAKARDFDEEERLTLELEASEQEAMSGEERGANILPVYLSVQNPLIVDMGHGADLVNLSAMIEQARAQGHDGLRLDNVYEPVEKRPDQFSTTQWVVFKPEQIKSATGNNGQFDARNPDLRFDRAGIGSATAEAARGGQNTPAGFVASEALTASAAFRTWFGASALTDAAGAPLVLYHGTDQSFDAFDPDRSSASAAFGKGIYLTENPGNTDWKRGPGANVMPVHVRSLRPLDIRSPLNEGDAAALQSIGLSRARAGEPAPLFTMEHRFGSVAAAAQAAGFDALLHFGPGGQRHVLAFSAYQIKSALGNNGAFDGQNPDIRFDRAARGDGDSEASAAEGIIPTQTTAFATWFKRSQIVNDDGSPRMVYRGESTGEEFTRFDRRKTGERAFFFTSDEAVARSYSRGKAPRAFYLSAQKVLDLTRDNREAREFVQAWAKAWDAEGWIDRASGDPIDPWDAVASGQLFEYEGDWSAERWKDLQASIEAAGYDGAILPDSHERSPMTAVIVFKPEQIKSATHNIGAFDPLNPDIRFQRAWHGSGVRGIRRFDTAKIGSGEGSQAFGYGLYFAQMREVAEHYRQQLAAARIEVSIAGRSFAQTPWLADSGVEERWFMNWIAHAIADGRAIQGDMHNDAAVDVAWRLMISANRAGDVTKEAALRRLVDEIRAGTVVATRVQGELYEVELPDPHEMLQWDLPWTRQPSAVQSALAHLFSDDERHCFALSAQVDEMRRLTGTRGDAYSALWEEQQRAEEKVCLSLHARFGTWSAPSGRAIYERLASTLGSPKAASDALAALGIKGIRYLDAGSRSAGEGSFNFVVFSGDDVTIVDQQRQREQAQRASAERPAQEAARFRRPTEPAPPAQAEAKETAAQAADAFNRWFAGSTVVTETGAPKVMYHGSYRDVSHFDRRKSTEWRRESIDAIGSWFSDNPSEDGGAGMYANATGGAIYPVYLAVRNPKRFQSFDAMVEEMHRAAGRDPAAQYPRSVGSPEALREQLIAQGHDGIELPRTHNQAVLDQVRDLQDRLARAKQAEFSVKGSERAPLSAARAQLEGDLSALRKRIGDGLSTEFDHQQVVIAFHPEQIKSAIGNNGQFDAQSPDIRFDREATSRVNVAGSSHEAGAPENAPPAARQRVWHGTRHRGIKRFDLARVGSGQGAASYGWGLYFAEERDVAEFYRQSLTRSLVTSLTDEMDLLVLNEEPIVPRLAIEGDRRLCDLAKSGDQALALAHARQRLARWTQLSTDSSYAHQAYAAEKASAWGVLADRLARGEQLASRSTGQLYEVEIPTSERFANWDLDMAGQNVLARQAITRVIHRLLSEGADLSAGSRDLRRAVEPYDRQDLLEEMVQRYGWRIEGDRLLRKSGEPIDESSIAMQLELRQGQHNYRDFGAIYRDLAAVIGSDRLASMALAEEGLAGIRYLDGQSRVVGAGTANYVLFNADEARVARTHFDRSATGGARAGAAAAQDQPSRQRVFHGSPYRGIERFEASKIGSGEGAADYGWGFYLASDRSVAQAYTGNEGIGGAAVPWFFSIRGVPCPPGSPQQKAADLVNSLGIAKARRFAANMLADARAGDDWTQAKGLAWYESVHATTLDIASKAQVSRLPGQLYEVDIPADDQFLHWELPLQQQPDAVKTALATLASRSPELWRNDAMGGRAHDSIATRIAHSLRGADDLTGKHLYRLMGQALGKTAEQVSAMLHGGGLAGIRYEGGRATGMSRATPCYVVFHADDARIVKPNDAAQAEPSDAERSARERVAQLRDQERARQDHERMQRRSSFERWFEGSAVVNPDGSPMVVYHGTHADFTAFAPNERGIFFAADPDKAAPYSRIRAGEPRILPVLLSIKRPWTMIRYGADVPYSAMVDQSVAALKAQGYDGIHCPEDGVWIAFEPTQIKSAIGNRGSFDRNNSDIRFSRSAGDQTNTPAFRAWFKDSKVVDAEGKPMVVYHATDKDFAEFDVERGDLGAHFGTADQAQMIASYWESKKKPGARTIPAYLSLQNPIRLEDRGAWSGPAVAPQLQKMGLLPDDLPPSNWAGADGRDAVRRAILRAGYDGVVYANTREGEGDSYIAFRPEQIKSAIGNRGSFDRNNSDIRFSRSAGDQHNTPAFRAWFKDSKVVDAEGKPLVVYHGTNEDFAAFDPERAEDGFFFTPSELIAKRFGNKVMPIYLNIQNPAEIAEEDWGARESKEELMAAGYDGVVVRSYDMGGGPETTADMWVAFRPEQIKSAIGNRGTFDRNDTDIRFERSAENPAGDYQPAVLPLQTATAAFQRWFATSKIVDEDGNPRVLHHGTTANFSVFKRSERGSFGAGIYFTTDRQAAEQYAQREDGGRVESVYARLRNPFYTPADHSAGEDVDLDSPAVPLIRALFGDRATTIIEAARRDDGMFGDEVRQALIARGHDGIVAVYPDRSQEVVVFEPEQIKSALSNNGRFDGQNPDIRFERSAAASAPIPTGSSREGLRLSNGAQARETGLAAFMAGSHVVDEHGRPLMVYHGTASDFSVFQPSRTGEFGPGIYCTSSPTEASAYTGTNASRGNAGLNVMPVYLSMKRPVVIKSDPKEFWAAFPGATDEESLAAARAAGHDGVIFDRPVQVWRDGRVVDTGERQRHYVVFDPSQVKSALGNNGQYDPENPDIRFERAGWTDAAQAAALATAAEAAQPDLFGGLADIDSTVSRLRQVSSRGDTAVEQLRNVDSAGRAITGTLQGLEAFWDWYDESALRDADGRPLLLYHGTGADVRRFETMRETMNVGLFDMPYPARRAGIFLTANLDYAHWIAETKPGANIMPVYARMANPADFRGGLSWELEQALEAHGFNTRVLARLQYDWEMFDEEFGGPDLVAALKRAGYDGAIFTDLDDERRTSTSYVVFEPEQVKSALGNRGTFSERDAEIHFDRAPAAGAAGAAAVDAQAPTTTAPVYRSALRAALESGPTRATAAQWRGYIAGLVAKGVRSEEIEWSGLLAWLDRQGASTRLDRAAVLARHRSHGVVISEVVKVERDLVDALRERLLYLGWSVVDTAEGEDGRGPVDGVYFRDSDREYGPLYRHEDLPEAVQDLCADLFDQARTTARYAGIRPEGGARYREILLRLAHQPRLPHHLVGRGADERHVITVDGQPREFTSTSEADACLQIESPPAPRFTSGHWAEGEVLAHLRVDDRVDADGTRVLFVSELQSDWGQIGRKVGFDMPHGSGRHIPSAPYVTRTASWVGLGVRRVLHLAATEGHARVVFTSGMQAAMTNRLADQVSHIEAERAAPHPTTGEARYLVLASNRQGATVLDRLCTASEIKRELGGAMGARLQREADRGGRISLCDLDITLGAEPLKAYYDRILPGVLRDEVRRIMRQAGGQQLSAREVSTWFTGGVTVDRASGAIALNITPALREQILQGLPLFERGLSEAQADTQSADDLKTEQPRALRLWDDFEPMDRQWLQAVADAAANEDSSDEQTPDRMRA